MTNTFFRICALVASVLVLVGCSILTRPVVTQQAVTMPGRTNVVVLTNYVPPVVVTNTIQGEPIVVTNYLPPTVITNTVIQPASVQYVSVTNYVPNEAFLGAMETAQQANSALNPTPSAPILNWILMLLGAVPGIVAAWRNNQKRKATEDLLNTVVAGVETAPEWVGIKEHIAAVSAIKGNAQKLDAFVQSVSPALSKTVAQGGYRTQPRT